MRRLAPRGADDAGFTLAEMAVAILIMGIVGGMISTFFISGIRTSGKQMSRNDDINQSRNALDRLQKDVQAAVADPKSTSLVKGPFLVAARNKVSFYARLDGLNDPTLVTWEIGDGAGTYNATLVRTAVRPQVTATSTSWASPPAPTSVATPTSTFISQQKLIRGVHDVNNGKIPYLFRYLDIGDAGLAQMCSDVVPVPGTCPTTVATPLQGDPLASTTPAPTASSTPVVDQAVSMEVYLQVATFGDGAASNNPPYFEVTGKGGSPTVLRVRLLPAIETNTTS